ncbi:Zinc finger BED domain-containing protein DAYSLEEPER [Zea mays]|uniref:Zinc finger BED domain-containing protein DAYSLEEPER n=1 Tax=Zea mays TaxID=4577 RepID=A0A1D6PUU1_MAIZE|nr:Zinc finger BED domain-containing protein DAYSLEEPER [Zea mays]
MDEERKDHSICQELPVARRSPLRPMLARDVQAVGLALAVLGTGTRPHPPPYWIRKETHIWKKKFTQPIRKKYAAKAWDAAASARGRRTGGRADLVGRDLGREDRPAGGQGGLRPGPGAAATAPAPAPAPVAARP